MPAKIFPGVGPLFGRRFIKTGAFRPPKKGEIFLSGAIPEAYRSEGDGSAPFHILREAREEETRCGGCGQRLPYSDKA